MNWKLAIVIPAYRAQYLNQALESIANQTCKDFTLYIGDDASPENLRGIVDRFVHKIKIVYHRFDNNIGLRELGKQWERCIELSSEEDYIWLFSDDDIMPESAVSLIYKAIESKNEFDLYRFNIRQIDANGLFLSDSTNHPEFETTDNFIYRRLKGETLSAACEYIFARRAYQKTGGFVHFPLAWGTDDATWYRIGQEKGICTLPECGVYWRLSGVNITSSSNNSKLKFKATLLFLKWLMNQNISEKVRKSISFALIRQTIILNVNGIVLSNYLFSIYRLIGTKATFKVTYAVLKRQLKVLLHF